MKRLKKRIDLFPSDLKQLIEKKYKNDFPSFLDVRDEERKYSNGVHELFTVIYLNGTNSSTPIFEKVFNEQFWSVARYTDPELKPLLISWLVFHMTQIPFDETDAPHMTKYYIQLYRDLYVMRSHPISISEIEINDMRIQSIPKEEYDRDFIHFLNEMVFQIKFLTTEI